MFNGILAILFGLCMVIVYGEIRKWSIKRKLRYFESPSNQLPIIGVAGRFIGKPNDEVIDVILDVFDEVKTTPIQLWFGPKLVIGVSEPQDIQIILTDENCLDKPYFYQFLKCKTSIIATDKEVWKFDRRSLNTAFNVKILQNQIPLLNDKAHILIRKMDAHLDKPGNVYQTIFIYMLDTIVRSTFGIELNMQSEKSPQRGKYYFKIFRQIMESIQYRMARYWLRWDFTYSFTKVHHDEGIIYNIGNKLFEFSYQQKKNEIYFQMEQSQNLYAQNFLEKCILMEHKGLLKRDNVLDQMRLIIFAGTDTLSITTFSTLLMLAINQKHQDLVVDELKSIFESVDCDVTQAHLTSMQYTERAIKESHRLLTPVPFIGRKTTADIKLPNGIVPKGTMVIVNIMRLHRNPNIWGKNTLEFDPDRFLPENIAKRPQFSFIPFSGGPRNCIGMKYAMNSAKIALAHLLRRYKFSTNLRFEDIRIKTHLVLEIANKTPLIIEKRQF